MARWLRRTLRRLTGRYPSMVCKLCGYRVPYLGNKLAQTERALDHWESNHDRIATPTEETS